jgi:tubulin-folding cofactor B
VRLSLDHSISSSKILEAKYDLNQTIRSVKENIEKRYGTDIHFMKLVLRDSKGNTIAPLNDDNRTLGSYACKDEYNILVIDSNPNSIHKEIEDLASVEKYRISDEDYDKLLDNFRKWKKQLLDKFPHLKKPKEVIDPSTLDPEYMKEIAEGIKIGNRVKLENGARGEVKYVGKIMDKGIGYFVGVQLDEPYGNSSGTIKGVKYFDAPDKYAMFLRPDKI